MMRLFPFLLLFTIKTAQCETNETTVQGEAEGAIIAGIPFQDYDAYCPDDAPVRLFQYKIQQLRDERDALLLNVSLWPAQDIVLRALCFNFTDFFGDEWTNVSWAECRVGESFVAGRTVWDNDPTYMCKQGEYVNGVSSEYVNGSRWLKLRCCKLEEFEQIEQPCNNVPPGAKYNDVLLKRRENCTIDMLTAATVSQGTESRVLGQYCGFEKKGFVPDPYCAAKRRIELKRTRSMLGALTANDEEAENAEAFSTILEQGNETTPGDIFDFACPQFQGIERIDAKLVDDDLVLSFFCDNITNGHQEKQWIRYTDYQPLPDTDTVMQGCDRSENEVLCGMKSYISPRVVYRGNPVRLYSFACCGLSNAVVSQAQDEEIRSTIFIPAPGNYSTASARPKGKPRRFLHRFHLEGQPNNDTFLVTAWSVYDYVDQPRSPPAATSDAGKHIRLSQGIFLLICVHQIVCIILT